MPGEGSGGDGGDGGGSGSDGGMGGDVGDILAYLNHQGFGNDGDYTGNAGYGGDNIGPPGSREPPTDENRSRTLIDALLTQAGRPPGTPPRPAARSARLPHTDPYGGGAMPAGRLHAFAGRDIDAFSGLAFGSERPDPFTGLPDADPFADGLWQSLAQPAPFRALRNAGLLSSPYLLAENTVSACESGLATCPPRLASDFNQSSVLNTIQAESDESWVAIQNFAERHATIERAPVPDFQELAAQAAQQTRTEDYTLGYTVNQLRTHPVLVHHSALGVGLGHVAAGGGAAVLSGVIIYGSGGLAFPLIGGMGLAAGTAEALSGLTLAFSGQGSDEALATGDKFDYIFGLTKSPGSLVFGTTGLVLSGGETDVSQRSAIFGGIVEDLFTARGNPSRLYSSILPGVENTAERAATGILVKDVTALGFTARANTVDQVAANLNRDFTVKELQAIAGFREEYEATGRLDLAGTAGHAAGGAAGPGGGADYFEYGAFRQELKLHGPYTAIDSFYLDKASTQSLNDSIKYQLDTWFRGEQLVPLRSVKHIWISPTEAVRFIGK